MMQETCECKKCKHIFILTLGEEASCPNCGYMDVRVIDIAF